VLVHFDEVGFDVFDEVFVEALEPIFEVLVHFFFFVAQSPPRVGGLFAYRTEKLDLNGLNFFEYGLKHHCPSLLK
jgi:hypothetical protein